MLSHYIKSDTNVLSKLLLLIAYCVQYNELIILWSFKCLKGLNHEQTTKIHRTKTCDAHIPDPFQMSRKHENNY